MKLLLYFIAGLLFGYVARRSMLELLLVNVGIVLMLIAAKGL